MYDNIEVTRPKLPSIDKYKDYLKKIWDNNWLTNNGPLCKELEDKLSYYLNVKRLFLVSNGTLALQLAIKSFDLKGEIITTPFSYVATTSSIVWQNCKPIFVDINKDTLAIDETKIEEKITDKTFAILPVNIYGIPCNIEKIQEIADKHNLKVIYDNAHGFATMYKDKSLSSYGDISILSFHATKLFQTVEGGAIITSDDKTAKRISYLRNFGHDGPERFFGLGINAKMSEFHAAMGLCNIHDIDSNIKERKSIHMLYDKYLKDCNLKKPFIRESTIYNYSYYPVIFDSEKDLLSVKEKLNNNNIFPRRYFYPSLSSLDYVEKQETPIADDLSKRVLCLPLYQGLSEKDIIMICELIKDGIFVK